MKNKSGHPLIAAFFLFMLGFVAMGCGSGTENDATIQSKISSVSQSTPELQNVSASVSKGVVTLFGQCRSEKERERAEKAIKEIDEVENVVNNITVTDNIVITSDNELRDQVSKVVRKHKRVRAETQEGIITLRGEVDKDDLQQLMMDLNALRPRRIDNQMVVE